MDVGCAVRGKGEGGVRPGSLRMRHTFLQRGPPAPRRPSCHATLGCVRQVYRLFRHLSLLNELRERERPASGVRRPASGGGAPCFLETGERPLMLLLAATPLLLPPPPPLEQGAPSGGDLLPAADALSERRGGGKSGGGASSSATPLQHHSGRLSVATGCAVNSRRLGLYRAGQHGLLRELQLRPPHRLHHRPRRLARRRQHRAAPRGRGRRVRPDRVR